MPSDIRYSPLARNDLDDIWGYIAKDLASPNAASKTVEAILKRAALLATFPDSGTPLSSVATYIGGAHRFVRSESYLIFYRHEDAIYIDRILNSRQNWLRTLFGEQA